MNDAEQISAWLDTLGLPDLGRCSYVRVATGRCFARGTDERQKEFRYGFLVEDDGTTFRVFDVDFLSPARAQDVVAEARVLRRGAVTFLAVDVEAADGTAVATALVTYRL